MADDWNLLPLFLLYAETHYAFKGVYSRLKKSEPEIIADAPHRIEPNMPISIMLLIKDSHKYPVIINRVEVDLIKYHDVVLKKLFPIHSDLIQQKYHSYLLYVDPPSDITGSVQLNVIFEISVGKKVKMYFNDNYRISSHKPLEVHIAPETLPKTKGWFYGDMHCHTSYTEDQAEFGAPLEPSIQLSKALGLSFFAATDHSYDLDDDDSNYLVNDPDLTKWSNFKEEVAALNEKYHDFVILPGEEISAGNTDRRNVHFLVINNNEFIPGKGDGAEKWFFTTPDLSIPEILNRIDDNALAIAAHSEMPPPFLQWLLIRRGTWQWTDYLHDRLNGMQIWNGVTDEGFENGIKRWVKLLLHGKRLFIYAGNDAHGNFNRFRQIGFPFWTFRELQEQIFGEMRTAVNLESSLNLENLVTALKKGKCLITDGPFVEFALTNDDEVTAGTGEEIGGRTFSMEITAISTYEFGSLQQLNIYCGNLTTKEEIILQKFDHFRVEYQFNTKITLSSITKPCYLRLELFSKTETKTHRCLTNPIWIK